MANTRKGTHGRINIKYSVIDVFMKEIQPHTGGESLTDLLETLLKAIPKKEIARRILEYKVGQLKKSA